MIIEKRRQSRNFCGTLTLHSKEGEEGRTSKANWKVTSIETGEIQGTVVSWKPSVERRDDQLYQMMLRNPGNDENGPLRFWDVEVYGDFDKSDDSSQQVQTALSRSFAIKGKKKCEVTAR